VDVFVPFPREQVYLTYRDRLLDLLPYLPNVRRIEMKQNRQEAGLLHQVQDWHGGGDIPAAARAFLSEDLLTWTNTTLWNDADCTADWRIQTHAFTEAVRCHGSNRFAEIERGTRIISQGTLNIDPQHLHGVPGFFRGAIAHTVEELLGSRIGPNFQQMAAGVTQYLQRKPLA